MRLNVLLFIGTLLIAMSCATTAPIATTEVEKVETPEEFSSHIVIVDFDVIKSKNNKYEISYKKVQSIPGKLKESVIIYPPRELGKLVVHLLDDKDEIIEELVIKKPYLQIIEEYDRGGNTELKNDDVRKNQFSVRFNENNKVKAIKIFKIGTGNTVPIFHEAINF